MPTSIFYIIITVLFGILIALICAVLIILYTVNVIVKPKRIEDDFPTRYLVKNELKPINKEARKPKEHK